jgi:hypothetical protein
MSSEHKVALARAAQGVHGLAPVLVGLEPSRSTWYYHQCRRVSYGQKYDHLREPLEAIARCHSAYGYRRTTVEMRETYGQRVNRKEVQRLHRMWGLPLIRGTKSPKPSGFRRAITAAGDRINLLAGKEAIRPFEVAYADFTELVNASGRAKPQLTPIVDHASKLVLGWAVDERAGGDRTGAYRLGTGQALREEPRGAHAGSDCPSRSGSSLHRLWLDRPAAAEGSCAGVLCPKRCPRQSGDGGLQQPLQE